MLYIYSLKKGKTPYNLYVFREILSMHFSLCISTENCSFATRVYVYVLQTL